MSESQVIVAHAVTNQPSDHEHLVPMLERMHQKVRSAQGREVYRRRKLIAEPVFGQIKQALGFRRFSLRGLTKVATEWGIACLCHNLRKLYRAVGSLERSGRAPLERDPSRRRTGALCAPAQGASDS